MSNAVVTLRILALAKSTKIKSSDIGTALGLHAEIKSVTRVREPDISYYQDAQEEIVVEVTPGKAKDSLDKCVLHRWCENSGYPSDWWLCLSGIEDRVINDIPTGVRDMEDRDVNIESFSFGSVLGLNAFVEHYTSTPYGKRAQRRPIRITQQSVDFINTDNTLYLNFVDVKEPKDKTQWSGETHARHRMLISYSSIGRIVLVRRRDRSTIAYLHLLSSPLLYRSHSVSKQHNPVWTDKWGKEETPKPDLDPEDAKLEDQDESFDDADINLLKEDVNACPEWEVEHKYVTKYEAQTESKYVRVVDFGKDQTYCGTNVLGNCRVLKLEFPSNDFHWDALRTMILHCRKIPVYFGPVREVPKKNGPGIAFKYASFDCQYALQCVLSCSAQVVDEMAVRGTVNEISDTLKKYVAENEIALQETLYELHVSLSHAKIVTFKLGLETLFNKYKSLRCKSPFTGSAIGGDLSEKVVLVRKAVLTPTKLLFLPPQLICKSRMLVHFDPEHAMRLIVREDDGRLLSFSLGVNRLEFLQSNTKPRLLKGFKVGNRKYEFLWSSTSQLRDHGAWYYSKDSQGLTVEDVRLSVGDLSAIKTAAKYMARLGQAFSQSIGFVHVPSTCTQVVEDITAKGKKNLEYNFSDGVGRISKTLLERVHKALPEEGKPCAIQIRYGGAKGMLLLDPTLEGDQIIFRRSMYKYPSSHEELFVLKTSKPRVVKLNRPMITILAQKGSEKLRDIQPEVFYQLQRICLELFMDSLFDSSKVAVIFKAETDLKLPFDGLVQAGLDLHDEPFFRNMLHAIHRRSIRDIKERANILVPPEFGRTMFGVMDETGTLRYGEVFVQYAKCMDKYGPDDQYEILTGDVVVTKNPCLHAGDIRRLRAVDVPALRHVRDCIVFPSVGKRPHSNEMAGSDMDGDEYSVIWYKDLIFRSNDDPMDFYSDPPPGKDGQIKVEDMVEFFCTYICNDVVGLIASAHLVWADLLKRGVKSEMCKRLSMKASQSVDYAKTGQPQSLRMSEMVQIYPDFMGKHAEKATYISPSVLGNLYRNCTAMEVELEATPTSGEARPDLRLLLPGRESYLSDAEKEFEEYDFKIRSLLITYGIDTEAEALSGAIYSQNKYVKEKHNPTDVAIVLQSQVQHIMKQMRNRFYEQLPNNSDYCEAKLKASAWYEVSYRQNSRGASAFPWIVADVLEMVLNDCDDSRRPNRGSLRDRFNNILLHRLEDDSEFHGVVTNNAIILLNKWVDSNAAALNPQNEEDLKKCKLLIRTIFVSTFKKLLQTYGKERLKLQPGLTILNCLKQACGICFHGSWDMKAESGKSNQRLHYYLGKLALKTFNRLLSVGDGSVLLGGKGFQTGSVLSAVVLVPIKEDQTTFFHSVMRHEDVFIELLKAWANVESVTFNLMRDRLDQWFLRLWVTGKHFAIEGLKEIVLKPAFKTIVTYSIEQQLKNKPH